MDIFYNLNHIKDKRSFLEDCISHSYDVKCDELDCSKSMARIMTDKTSKEILDITKNAGFIHWSFIMRKPIAFLDEGKTYIEAGLRVSEYSGSVDYFIWIYINIEKLDYFVEKYKIK
ncbi:hypothetical protein LCGC14_0458520 [marine sediment metagenome]|uniref:Uncharacterized protein n=1 Tax=marine sediment metagenome TaxID=412755 RepID=A0A0F9SYJ5_9ZZZZ